MPYRLDTHVLTVDANVIHKVDTTNPANLYSMWTVFSRCADSVEQGRRLENLSWRIWQREQLVESSNKHVDSTKNTLALSNATTTAAANPSISSTTPSQEVPTESRIQEVPQLSGSVDSLADEEAVEFASVSAPVEIRPRIQRLDSSNSRRDRHISSDDFEKMVVSIVKDRTPLSAPSQTSPLAEATKKQLSLPATPTLMRTRPTATESRAPPERPCRVSQPVPSPVTEGNQVRTCSSPSPAPAAAASSSSSFQYPVPEPSSSPAAQHVQPKKQPAVFALGGSCSSSEQEQQSVENIKANPVPTKKLMFQIGDSSGEDSILSSVQPTARISPPPPAPPPSSNALISSMTAAQAAAQASQHNESAIDSDTETEYVDESAIDDDDDSSDWEDSVEDSGKSSVDDKFFQRVESKVQLTSRPSLITLMIAQNERARILGGGSHASQSTPAIQRARAANPNGTYPGGSPNDSDETPLMMKGMRPSMLKPISEIPRSSAQPINATATHIPFQAALSPRTTRRNMLATELTESLRRHLLWERQQKNMTAKASLKRRHTSHDVANLKQFPDRVCMKASEDAEARSWNHNFSREHLNGYHSKGW